LATLSVLLELACFKPTHAQAGSSSFPLSPDVVGGEGWGEGAALPKTVRSDFL